MRISLLALVLFVQGCIMANMTPTARFQESAHNLTEAARWGHVDMAMPLLSPKYSSTYLAQHREWGSTVTIADAELTMMHVADDHDSAVSEVTFSWYTNGGVTLRTSTLTQKWEADHGQFKLVSEVVRTGDPGLLAAVETAPSEPTAPIAN